jgi:hypothetical protein
MFAAVFCACATRHPKAQSGDEPFGLERSSTAARAMPGASARKAGCARLCAVLGRIFSIDQPGIDIGEKRPRRGSDREGFFTRLSRGNHMRFTRSARALHTSMSRRRTIQ